jgi:hypothetical protein
MDADSADGNRPQINADEKRPQMDADNADGNRPQMDADNADATGRRWTQIAQMEKAADGRR